MKQKTLGRTGLKVSTIAYGGIVSTMSAYANYTYSGDGQQASDDYVEYALEAGINYYDVAPKYGDAQEKLGNSLRGVRDNICWSVGSKDEMGVRSRGNGEVPCV